MQHHPCLLAVSHFMQGKPQGGGKEIYICVCGSHMFSHVLGTAVLTSPTLCCKLSGGNA